MLTVAGRLILFIAKDILCLSLEIEIIIFNDSLIVLFEVYDGCAGRNARVLDQL